MRKIILLLPILAALLLLAPQISAGTVAVTYQLVDDFEAYGDDGQLAAVWNPEATPAPLLKMSGGADGGKSMAMMANRTELTACASCLSLNDASVVANGTSVTRDVSGLTLGSLDFLTIWYKGGAEYDATDILRVGLIRSGSYSLLASKSSLNTASSWTRWDIDVSGEDLSGVTAINLELMVTSCSCALNSPDGAQAADEPVYSEAVLVDLISFNDGAIWNGGSSEWHLFSNWHGGIPQAGSKAIIPGFPTFGIFPVLSGPATVNELRVDAGAELNLGAFDITVNNLLTNSGKIQQTKVVGSSSTVNFIHTGGYKGVTVSYPAAAPDGAFARDAADIDPGLGSTTVVVSGNQRCPGVSTGILRCFDIAPEYGDPLFPAAITLFFSDAERDSIPCESINPYHYNQHLGQWQPLESITRSCSVPPFSVSGAVAGFSPFTAGSDIPTAVSLADLTASSPNVAWLLLPLAGLLLATAVLANSRKR